jgi:hypothetical protein
MRNCFIFFIILINASFSLIAQTTVSTPQQTPGSTDQNPAERNRSTRNSAAGRNFFPFKAKRNKDQERRLKPSAEDVAKYSEFLKQPKTGIFRLVNDLECESDVYVIRVDENCRNSIPGGSFYSFREKEHTTAYLADLRLKDGLMISDGILSQNILVRLGDFPLENLSVDTGGMQFLTNFVPEAQSSEATKQYIEIVRGIRTENHEYRKVLPSILNNTYAIRIIAYRGSVYRTFRGWLFDLLAGDNRVDLTIGFRVVRKDADGGITLLWKELDRKKSPKLKNEKKKKAPVRSAPFISNKQIAEN